jgi:hypothetical protein
MDIGDWILSAFNAVAASLLLNSGIAKTVAPKPPRRAVEELLPALDSAVVGAVVRTASIIEIAMAAALPFSPLRVPAAVVIALLGTGFALLGLLGIARHSETPCGCFGTSGKRPLGWSNVLLGLALTSVYPVNAAWSPGGNYPAATLLSTSILSIALCVYMQRELVVQLLAPQRGRPAGPTESEAH